MWGLSSNKQSVVVNPLQNKPESGLFVFKSTRKFSRQNLPVHRENVLHSKAANQRASFGLTYHILTYFAFSTLS